MTPLIKFGPVHLKREDQHPTGSAKDRAIPYQVAKLIRLRYQSAVISSSGNAAISAIYHCQKKHLPLKIFLSPQTNPSKLKLILSQNPDTTITPSPNSQAFKYAKLHHSYLLRQSTDPAALKGYSRITPEIMRQLPSTTSIFVPVGSGTTLLGISQKLPTNIMLFAVQPAVHAPIAGIFQPQYTKENNTITDALSVKLIPLKSKVIDAIVKHHGSGIVVNNQQVIAAQQELTDNQIDTSPEGALCLAGYHQAKLKFNVGSFPVILLTGTKR